MGKMYTLQPDESINDHMKESITMLNELARSIGADYYLNSTMIKNIKPDSVRSVIEHVRNTIEMLNDLCDELDDDLREVRKAYADDMECVRKYGTQSVDAERLFVQLNEDCECFRLLAISRNKELEQERTRSNQLEKELSDKTRLFELAKKFLHQRRDQLSVLEEEMRQNLIVKNAQKKVIDEKEKQISDLHHEIWELQEQAEYLKDQVKFWKNLAKAHVTTPNNPQNFCGNCKYFAFVAKEDGMHGCCHEHYLKEVGPDDASCDKFCHSYEKPDHEVCNNCDKECDDCGYYPF